RSERRDRRAVDARRARPARRLRSDAVRARAREAPSSRRAHEDQRDARARRARRRDSTHAGRPGPHRRRHRHVRSVPAAHDDAPVPALEQAKRHRPDVLAKTSVMLGLGERGDEIRRTLDDLARIGVDIVTFGQYLRPTPNHLPVERYVTPDEFAQYREWGLE